MKRCPFCKETSLIEWKRLSDVDEYKDRYVIKCLACGASGPEEKSRTEAKLAWDDRKKR